MTKYPDSQNIQVHRIAGSRRISMLWNAKIALCQYFTPSHSNRKLTTQRSPKTTGEQVASACGYLDPNSISFFFPVIPARMQ